MQKPGGSANPDAKTQLARALILKYSTNRESEDVTQARQQLDITIGLTPQRDPLLPSKRTTKLLRSKVVTSTKEANKVSTKLGQLRTMPTKSDSETYPISPCVSCQLPHLVYSTPLSHPSHRLRSKIFAPSF